MNWATNSPHAGALGTGKSFIGRKMLQFLLPFIIEAKATPVLVVTYKNHSLDQFLEGCMNFTDVKLCRIGGKILELPKLALCSL